MGSGGERTRKTLVEYEQAMGIQKMSVVTSKTRKESMKANTFPAGRMLWMTCKNKETQSRGKLRGGTRGVDKNGVTVGFTVSREGKEKRFPVSKGQLTGSSNVTFEVVDAKVGGSRNWFEPQADWMILEKKSEGGRERKKKRDPWGLINSPSRQGRPNAKVEEKGPQGRGRKSAVYSL